MVYSMFITEQADSKLKKNNNHLCHPTVSGQQEMQMLVHSAYKNITSAIRTNLSNYCKVYHVSYLKVINIMH